MSLCKYLYTMMLVLVTWYNRANIEERERAVMLLERVCSRFEANITEFFLPEDPELSLLEDVFTTVAPEADIVPELSSEAVAFTSDDLQT